MRVTEELWNQSHRGGLVAQGQAPSGRSADLEMTEPADLFVLFVLSFLEEVYKKSSVIVSDLFGEIFPLK